MNINIMLCICLCFIGCGRQGSDGPEAFNTIADCPKIIIEFGLENQFEQGKWEAYRSSFRCDPFVLINSDTMMIDTLNYGVLLSLVATDINQTIIHVSYIDANGNNVLFKKSSYVSEFTIGIEYNEVMAYTLAYGFTKFNSLDYLRTTNHYSDMAEKVYRQHTASQDTTFINFILCHESDVDTWLYLAAKNKFKAD